MNSIENYFLASGFSWTMSKMLPYLATILLGVVLFVIVRKTTKNKNIFVRLIANLLAFVAPFIIYFIINPIYEADFSNDFHEVAKSSFYNELDGKKLVVLTIPNCPYCFEAIAKMKRLKERVPTAKIEYVICTSDSVNFDDYAKWYADEGEGALTVRRAKDAEMMSKLADHVFPTFIFVDNDKPLKKWSNNSFGVVALDKLELLLK